VRFDDRTLELRHLEVARQELEALIDSIDSMGDLGRFLPDLRRTLAQMDADREHLAALLDVELS
jgi:hypothetical protein